MPDDVIFSKDIAGNVKPPTDKENRQELNEINEREYLKKIRAKNKKNLIKLDYLERERVAKYISDLYMQNKSRQKEISDDMDNYDDIYRMKPISLKDADADTPNYRTPLSTVSLEVIHANEMNVFFTPEDVMKVIPTEEGDIPKVSKLDTFANWSMKNEMKLFENADRLFHSSGKNGECPYIIHWVKEYGTEIKIEPIMNPADRTQPLIDEDTKEVVTQEREVSKLLYNGPRFEIFSRKDYVLPENAMADKIPDWELRILRQTADKVNRYCLEGKYYEAAFDEIGGWGAEYATSEDAQLDKEGNPIPAGKTEKTFVEFYGRMRINAVKKDDQDEKIYDELEGEFIGTVEVKSQTLCAFRKNKFPLKLRPIGMDTFIPDDEGRIGGTGVMEFMESLQNSNDVLHNQYLFGVIQANDPFGFFSPTGNMQDEPMKVKHGYLYPSSDPGSINIVKLPPPDQSMNLMMELVRNYAQLLFGIGDYQAGLESQIDPSAPAKKAEIVVAQGNVRLNLIIKRKNKTLKDIFKRWFLLYQANMPPNKFMRIAGVDKHNPWKFEPMNMSDFALKSIPDFELTGNILSSNKSLEARKAISIYTLLAQNPFFNPETREGMQALHALTKWLLDKMDETGVSSFLPKPQGTVIDTPEEENAKFLQGDDIEVADEDDHVSHLRVHSNLINDPTVPDDVKGRVVKHSIEHSERLKKAITQQMVMAKTGQNAPQGAENVQRGPVAPTQAPGVLQDAGVGGFQSGAGAGV